MNNLNRASKKKISSIKNTVTAFLKSAEFSKANGAKATKALMQDDDFFSSIPDQSGTEFDCYLLYRSSRRLLLASKNRDTI